MEALGIDFLTIIVYIINFGLVLFVLQRFAFKPVQAMLAKRQEQIAEGLSAAAKANEEAAQQRAEFEQQLAKERQAAQAESQKAAEATEKMRQDILEAARKEAEEIKTKAREEAAQERQQVMADLRQQAAELSMQMTRKVVGEAVDESAQRKLVNQFLADLGDA